MPNRYFEIIGQTSTGIFAEVVEAKDSQAALKIGKPLVNALNYSPRKITQWSVRPVTI